MSGSLPPVSRILVTGATGFTGRVLTRRLAAEGHELRAIVRPSSQLGDLESLPVTWIRGDVYDPACVQEGMDGVHYVFHMATLYRDASAAADEHHRVHVESTKLLARAALRQPGFRRFVHVSTVGVHGHIEHPPADENAPFAPGDAYQESKLEGEQWLRGFATENGLSHTVLRPAAIYGPEDKRLLKLFRMAAKPFFPLVGKGKCLYHLIHVEDLAELMIRAAVLPVAEGEVYICGNPEPIGLEDIGRLVAETLGKPFRVLRVPAGPLFFAADVCEALCRPLKISPPLYRRRVAFFTKDRSFDTRKLQTHFTWTPLYSNEEGVRRTAQAYREAGEL